MAPTKTTERYREELAKQPAGLRGLFSPERSLKRQFSAAPSGPASPTVMVDAFNIMQDRVTRARLAGDPPDVTISPRIGHIGLFDFHRAQEAIEIGARTTQRSARPESTRRSPRCPRSLRPPNQSGGLDVVAQRVLLVLHLVQAMLHDVADRDDAGELCPARPPERGGIFPPSSAP